MNPPEDFDGVQHEYDWGEIAPSTAILESIATLEESDKTEVRNLLDSPLHSYFDPDALGTLVRSSQEISITLEVEAYHIQINGDTVGVTPVEP